MNCNVNIALKTGNWRSVSAKAAQKLQADGPVTTLKLEPRFNEIRNYLSTVPNEILS
jgi:hypothetical protein